MGFPDAQKLLEHARREADAGESFFEFRLDHLATPEQGIAVIRKFLAAQRLGAWRPFAARRV
jgi:3-dehydroquinate dehydratase / shikimate dehydrogenase